MPDEGAAQPEPPKQVLNIEVKDNLLTVELLNAEFGSVMKTIAEKSGFKVEIYSDVLNKKVSTKFRNIDLERGIVRLLTLIKEKNYTILYDPKGALSMIDIYGSSSPATVKPPQYQPPARPQAQRNVTTLPSQAVQPPAPPATIPRPAVLPPAAQRRPPLPVKTYTKTGLQPASQQTPQPAPVDEDTVNVDAGPEEDVDMVPYIPAQNKPVYIPPKAK